VVTVETLLPSEIRKHSGAAQRIDPPIDDVMYKGPDASATTLESPKSTRKALQPLSRRIFDFKERVIDEQENKSISIYALQSDLHVPHRTSELY